MRTSHTLHVGLGVRCELPSPRKASRADTPLALRDAGVGNDAEWQIVRCSASASLPIGAPRQALDESAGACEHALRQSLKAKDGRAGHAVRT